MGGNDRHGHGFGHTTILKSMRDGASLLTMLHKMSGIPKLAITNFYHPQSFISHHHLLQSLKLYH
mgnify:CR=1 FL=1